MAPLVRDSRGATSAGASAIARGGPSGDAEEWAAGDRVGFDHEQRVEGGTVRVALEKDFACPDRPEGDATEDTWAFPNPSVVCR